MFRLVKRKLDHGLRLVFRMVGPWLLYRLAWMLEESLVTGILVDWYEYTSTAVTLAMPYVDLGFSGCALLITVVSGKQWLNSPVMHRFVHNILATLGR